MNSSEKIEAYKQLVLDVQNCDKLSDCNNNPKGVQLEKCPFCNEINLWSYWQGGTAHLNAKILLVGQDWGNYNDPDSKTLMESIRLYNDDHNNPCDYLKGNDNPTDKNLCKLFDSIGIKIDKSNTDVFFTNYVLCYRSGNNGISGGFKQRWAKNCSSYFIRLVQIIEPKIIICLGRAVFSNVLKAAGIKMPHMKYNDIIESKVYDAAFGDHACKVYPVAHCGVLGTNNRNRDKEFSHILDVQKQDWKKMMSELK